MKKISQKGFDKLIKVRLKSLNQTDLSCSNLPGDERAEVRFKMAKLLHATLTNARMSGADLSRARLIGANLSGADLSRAELVGANLCRANLSGANLTDARLIFSYLMGTDLSGANLTNADLKDAKYDQETKWPEGFDPTAAGAILKT